MEVHEVNLGEIKQYENNPRKNSKAIDKVAKSIKDFGFKVPLVLDQNNVIVCGHTRYLAAQKIGLKTLPCVIANDLTASQIKAFRLADNKVSEFSEWDFSKLEKELQSMDLSLADFGFDDVSSNCPCCPTGATLKPKFDEQVERVEQLNMTNEKNSTELIQPAKLESAKTRVRVGSYHFDITGEEYTALINSIKVNYGFTNQEVLTGLKNRLLSCN